MSDDDDFALPWAPTKKETTRYYDVFKRDPKRDKFYNSKEWKAVRKKKIDLNPLCETCERLHRIRPARHVHHLVPISTDEGWERRLRLDGLQSLCLPCHNRVKREAE